MFGTRWAIFGYGFIIPLWSHGFPLTKKTQPEFF
jgi:hypothetical protein